MNTFTPQNLLGGLSKFKGFAPLFKSGDTNQSSFLNPTSSANAISSIAEDRSWAETQANKQMDFQREMSNTSYQRAVKDLQKAGLNPTLAYSQGGASAPSGTSAQTSSTYQKDSVEERKLQYQFLFTMINSATKLIAKIIP
ncbi:MAG: DNA pilot protein [Microvirus sp.]|nr:MAG: DNA pilot protein [Microvirus sp.]